MDEDTKLASISWLEKPSFPQFEEPALPGALVGESEMLAAENIPFELQEALAGSVPFSSGETPSAVGSSEVTIEDVLSGAGLLEAVIGEDEEEGPLEDSAAEGAALWDEVFAGLGSLGDGENAPSAEEIATSYFAQSNARPDFFPYPNHGMMKTDILFSSSSLRFSRSQKEAILSWGKDLGAREVPSLYKLDRFERDALEAIGDPTIKVKAASGNVFYMNSIRHALARDYAHPQKRRSMHVYPEFTGDRVCETWQASKWLVDAPDEVLTPMIRLHGHDFYVNELIMRTEAGRVVFAPDSADFASKMLHPDRAVAEGLEVECPPIIVFIDDVSGNSSKQWNVHYSCYMSNGSLPHAELEQEVNVQFVATSPHASPMELIKGICDELRGSGVCKPFTVWDAVKERCVLIRPWILFLPGDNPMQAELCSHIGLKGNHFCRSCHVGGDKVYKASDEGYASLTAPGPTRTVAETREAVMSQLMAATHAGAEKRLKQQISSSGVKDSFAMPTMNYLIAKGKLLRKATTTRKALSPEEVNKALFADLMEKKETSPLVNPLLDMPGLDVHLDTPVEPLHTHLLGVVKYFWAQTVWVLEKQSCFGEFQTRLMSISRTGLKIPNIMAEYMCKYRGGLIGKHFKTISQVISFAVRGLVDDELQRAWGAIGRLTVLIWEAEISNMPDFLVHAPANPSSLSPGLLTEKNKFHILLHLPDHIERFGPALLFSTERYESFNHVFRLCSIHSNRQAPSRDIASAFANQARCRHILTGGYWYDKARKQWVHAGAAVLSHVDRHPIDARLLGISRDILPVTGGITLAPLQPHEPGSPSPTRAPPLPWRQTKIAVLAPDMAPQAGLWHHGVSVITRSGDTAPLGGEVIFALTNPDATRTAPEPKRNALGSVVEILSSHDPQKFASWIVIRESQLHAEPHPLMNLPRISRSGAIHLVDPKSILCTINVQHDCASLSMCAASGTQAVLQERELTTRTRPVVQHTDETHFLINSYALHNHRYLRQTLPPTFFSHTSLFPDRSAVHRHTAATLRDSKLQKKLAKEAAIRKTAEAARKALSTNVTFPDILGLADTASGPDSEEPKLEEQPGLVALDEDLVAARKTSTEELAAAVNEATGQAKAASGTVSDIVALQDQREEPSETTPAVASRHFRAQSLQRAMGQLHLILFHSPTMGIEDLLARFNVPSTPSSRAASTAPSQVAGSASGAPSERTPGSLQPQELPEQASVFGPFNHALNRGPEEDLGSAERLTGDSQADSERARQREDDDEQDEFTSRFRERTTAHRIKSSAKAKAQKHSLSVDQVAELLEFCELSPLEMLIDIKIHCMRTDNDILKRFTSGKTQFAN
ncbi:hypothetical protein BN946_scf184912.g49 [Trametes cinnabarina]|uniref:Uncharacterized protein n=1 Tax=Pycnoporus cinnabarinus TaxID=5643 RepID=A0A060ST30_PYCCI|nr:hypothetical protein BN946_scf184912.g49 [Trametes cinnabarina]